MKNKSLIYSLLLSFLIAAFSPMAMANSEELSLDTDAIYAQADESEEDYDTSEGEEIPLDNDEISSEDGEE